MVWSDHNEFFAWPDDAWTVESERSGIAYIVSGDGETQLGPFDSVAVAEIILANFEN